MLWTLWRAMLIDFWRLLLLSTAVLVTVIAFAATVKPLADGKLTADQAIRFMLLAIPPMLAYALPFAAGFAATLTYHRMTEDNEVTASKASGISHKRLLIPALLSGLLLAAGLWTLNDRVIPLFLHRMQEMITRDFARLMVNSLQQGDSAKIGNTEIHADNVQSVDPEPGSPVQQQFLLTGVAMVETDATGAIKIDGTARRAWILMLPAWALGPEDRARIGDDDATAVVMKFVDVTIYRDGAPQSADPLIAPAIPIPSVFEDDPKYASGAQMARITHDPDSMSFVDRRRVALARSLAAQRTYADFDADLRAGRPALLRGGDGSTIRVLGAHIAPAGDGWAITPVRETGSVELEVTAPTGRTDRVRARSAVLQMQTTADRDPMADQTARGVSRFRLVLGKVTVLGSAGQPGTELDESVYADLTPARDPLPALLDQPSRQLIASSADIAAAMPEDSPITRARRMLIREIDYLEREVLSKQHERLAMSAQCLVMVICGSVMAMYLASATPLVVYLWSFFPALLSLVMLESGQQITHGTGIIGLPVMWGAIAALAALTAVVFRRLARR